MWFSAPLEVEYLERCNAMLWCLSGMNIYKCFATFFSSEGGNNELELVQRSELAHKQGTTLDSIGAPPGIPISPRHSETPVSRGMDKSKVAFSSEHTSNFLYIGNRGPSHGLSQWMTHKRLWPMSVSRRFLSPALASILVVILTMPTENTSGRKILFFEKVLDVVVSC